MLPFTAAFLSAVFASLATLLVKCFVKRTDSTIVTTLQTLVMLFSAFLICLLAGSFSGISQTDGRSLLFMILSGIATGLTWLTYYRALRDGDADKVMPIEKANIFLTILIAVFFFREMRHLPLKLAGSFLVLLGLGFLMAGSLQKKAKTSQGNSRWLGYALLSSLFAAANTIFSKLSLSNMDSNLGTLLNTAVALGVVLVFLAAEGKLSLLAKTDKKEAAVIACSGISTAICWVLYYYAVKYGPMTLVAPLNKLSVPMVILFSHYVLGTKIQKQQGIGLTGIVAGMMLVASVA